MFTMMSFIIRSLSIVWIASLPLARTARIVLTNVVKPSCRQRHFSFFPIYGMGFHKGGACRPCERSEAIQMTDNENIMKIERRLPQLRISSRTLRDVLLQCCFLSRSVRGVCHNVVFRPGAFGTFATMLFFAPECSGRLPQCCFSSWSVRDVCHNVVFRPGHFGTFYYNVVFRPEAFGAFAATVEITE
jgi:hypothetical protein